MDLLEVKKVLEGHPVRQVEWPYNQCSPTLSLVIDRGAGRALFHLSERCADTSEVVPCWCEGRLAL